jgi:hypothetical protein
MKVNTTLRFKFNDHFVVVIEDLLIGGFCHVQRFWPSLRRSQVRFLADQEAPG